MCEFIIRVSDFILNDCFACSSSIKQIDIYITDISVYTPDNLFE
jgi:hypothetical protein